MKVSEMMARLEDINALPDLNESFNYACGFINGLKCVDLVRLYALAAVAHEIAAEAMLRRLTDESFDHSECEDG